MHILSWPDELTELELTLFAAGIAKVFVLWWKKDVFGELIKELAGIWPVPPLDEEAQTIKNKSLSALRMAHQGGYQTKWHH